MPTDTTTTVTERGQTSIPAEVRRELGLGAGTRLHWERVSDRELRVIVMTPATPAGPTAMLGFARRFRPETRSTDAWMRILREGEDGVDEGPA